MNSIKMYLSKLYNTITVCTQKIENRSKVSQEQGQSVLAITYFVGYFKIKVVFSRKYKVWKVEFAVKVPSKL